jgi:hypothetical protein
MFGAIAVIMIVATVMLSVSIPNNKESYEIPEPVELTYVSGTEYYFADEGEVSVELQDYSGTPIDAFCFATIYYPNKTTLFGEEIMDRNMDSLVYYYDFVVPEVVGVY